MKITKILILAAILSPLCVAADKQQLAEKILELAGTEAAMQQGFELGMKPGLDQMHAQGAPDALISDIRAEALKFFRENFVWAEVKPQFALLYADAFTESELADLVRFYETPTGKKAAALVPSLMQKGASFAMARVQSKMPEFQQRLGVLIKTYQDKAAPTPPAAAGPVTPHQP